MPQRLLVEVAADVSQYLKSLRASEKATELFAKEVTVDARVVAEAQVKAAVRSTEALEKQAAAYRHVAATAEKGSKEQVAAARLAATADARLARELGTVGREASTAHARSRTLERDMERMSRGALLGSGAVRGLGRSLVFASGGFLAFQGATAFLRDSVDAAREAGVAQRQLGAQMRAAGESFGKNREEIERVAVSYGKFGFTSEEVEQSLTVLERGTGNISKAIELQGLTADIARAKNLDLSKAATVVAKVFGGQETALRRAVPGLAKNAHGMDLIRLAQAKMAGQAAASTTAAERFHATLHDTEVIVGSALLPTLNRYLRSVGNWLQRMNESGKLQHDVTAAVGLFNDAISATKTILGPVVTLFKALGDAVGGTKRELELLLGVWAGAKFASKIYELAAAVKALQAARAAAAGGAAAGAGGAAAGGAKGGLFGRLAVGGLSALGVTGAIGVGSIAAGGAALLYMQKKAQDAAAAVGKLRTTTFEKGSGLETVLVPNLAKQIEALKKAGVSSGEIIRRLRARLGGSLKADDLIAEAFAFSSGSDPKLQKRIREQVAKRADEATNTATNELKKRRGPTIAQRNTWFDQMIDRMIGGVEDTPTGAPAALRTQLARLRNIAAVLQKRIDATKDITRKLKLERQLQDVLNEEWQKRQEVAQKQKEAVQKVIDALEVNVARAGLTKSLSDDVAAQKVLVARLREQVRATHGASDAWQALISAQGQLNDLEQQAAQQRQQAAQQRQQRIAARQFRALGLDPTGGQLIPGAQALRKQLAALEARTAGTLIGQRNQALFARLQKVLSGRLGKVGRQVRESIQQILADIRQQLADATQAVSSDTGGTGGTGGTLGSTVVIPPRMAGQYALAGATPGYGGGYVAPIAIGKAPVTINGGVHLHGVQDVSQLENELQKRSGQRAQARRGPS